MKTSIKILRTRLYDTQNIKEDLFPVESKVCERSKVSSDNS